MKYHKSELSDFQKNPESISTDTVQLWRNGIMITAQLTKKDAQEMIKKEKAFCITDQAIGYILDDGTLFS